MTRKKCRHEKISYYCIECYKLGIGGNGICSCLKRQRNCFIHGGGNLCPCGKQKQSCVKCKGISICACGKQKQHCKNCCGKKRIHKLCACGKRKQYCLKCHGNAFCACGKRKYNCVKCGGKLQAQAWCSDHKIERRWCIQCFLQGTGGSGLCPCLKHKNNCQKCNPNYFIYQVRKSIRGALKRKGSVKTESTLSHLGIKSFDELKNLFEVKIKCWNDNYPEDAIEMKNMAIDHIKPVAAFDDSEEAKREVNHYTNLQPLPRDVNAHKSSKWSEKDEEFWRANIIGNAQFREIYLPCLMQNSSTLNTNT